MGFPIERNSMFSTQNVRIKNLWVFHRAKLVGNSGEIHNTVQTCTRTYVRTGTHVKRNRYSIRICFMDEYGTCCTCKYSVLVRTGTYCTGMPIRLVTCVTWHQQKDALRTCCTYLYTVLYLYACTYLLYSCLTVRVQVRV